MEEARCPPSWPPTRVRASPEPPAPPIRSGTEGTGRKVVVGAGFREFPGEPIDVDDLAGRADRVDEVRQDRRQLPGDDGALSDLASFTGGTAGADGDPYLIDRGVEVTLVELKDIQLPDSIKRAMARQAEAEREKRAKIINAESESLAAAALGEASDIMMAHPVIVPAATTNGTPVSS